MNINPEIKQITDNLRPAFTTAYKSFQEKIQSTLDSYLQSFFESYFSKIAKECHGLFESEWQEQMELHLTGSPGRKKMGSSKKQEPVTHRILSLQKKYFEKYLFTIGEDIVKQTINTLNKSLDYPMPCIFSKYV